MRIYKIVSSIIFFLLVFFAVYWLHIFFFPVRVLLYSSIFDAVVASIFSFLTLYLFNFFTNSTFGEKLLLALLFVSIGYSIAVSVPTVIDRSLSFYILEKLQQRGGGINQAAFDRVFKEEYFHEHRLVDIRLTEQLESGTITIIDGCVRLTEKGNKLASFSRFFRAHFLPQKRVLLGEVTSDLVDPFKNSPAIVDYMCKD